MLAHATADLLRALGRRLARPRPLADHPAAGTFRVMTYNTHHGADRAGVEDIEAVAATIERCRPDVVALQEVDRHWSVRSRELDQAAWYAERLGVTGYYAPSLLRDPADGSPEAPGYGLALLSRLPSRAFRHQLYAAGPGEPRGMMEVLVEAPGPAGAASRTVRVVNTHLSVRAPRRREAETAQLVAWADPASDLPTVLGGDFNALARARSLRTVRSSYHDAWDVGLGDPATVPGRRIDYLWLSRHLIPVQTVVVRSPASDHFAVVSDLTWS